MLAFLLSIIVLCNSLSLLYSLNDEGSALMAFKQSVVDPQGSLNNWNYSHENPCSWNGVKCYEQRVVALCIPKSRLSGLLSSSLGSLSNLRHVNLRNNMFSGKLPSEVFQAEGLQRLVISGNSFSGFIPSEIGRLKYLQSLDLSYNFFNGSLPTSLIQCNRLETLNLSSNKFTGSIPSELGNLSNLRGTLNLSHNLFIGSIPPNLGNLPKMVYIDLTYNNLSGPIPQNDALINDGPTAFIGNPGLCGHPLKNPCSSDAEGVISPTPYPNLPTNYSPADDAQKPQKVGNGKGLSRSGVIAIIVCDVIGICIAALLFSYCYSRICVCGKRENENDYGFEKEGGKGMKEFLCFRKDGSETSENVEQFDLVPLDSQVGFNMDELLKASAFVLGKSGIGIVYKVVLQDGLNLAVRRLGEGGSQRFREFQTEVEAIGKLRHPNIVTIRAYYWSADEKLLICDYMPNGNLATAIHGKPELVSFTPLSWSVRLNIVRGIAKGLAYLHEYSPKKYVHGHLKPSNILLGQNMEPQISDFGLGRLANIAGGSPIVHSNRMMSEKPQQGNIAPSEFMIPNSPTILGSYYQSPEALNMAKPSQKWDVYSFGVIVLELITGRQPAIQVGSTEMNVVQWILLCIEEKKPLSHVLDPHLPHYKGKEEEIVGVLKIAIACAHSNPEKRPAMRHVAIGLETLPSSTE